MIKQLFKTILILSICICISIQSNAGGVKVSDGSAFITKSEMAYQLNNLSNRMSVLENSLDSRIDTLVSSYLTRNGIWNGAKQTLTNNYTGWTGFWNESGDMHLDALRYDPSRSNFIDRTVQNARIGTYNQYSNTNKITICTFNKTGLVCLNYDVIGSYARYVSGAGTVSNQARICGTTGNNYYCIHGATATVQIVFGVGSDIKMNIIDSVAFAGHIGLLFASSQRNSQYFFVNKGDVLQAWSASSWSGSGSYGFWDDPSYVHAEGYLIRAKINDISVY